MFSTIVSGTSHCARAEGRAFFSIVEAIVVRMCDKTLQSFAVGEEMRDDTLKYLALQETRRGRRNQV